MSGWSSQDAMQVESAPVAAAEEVISRPIQLNGDEIIQFSIKPSLWYIPIVSARFLLAVGLLAAVLIFISWRSWSEFTTHAVQALVLLGMLRISVGALQWASRLYVLTNRRVMRFRGVLRVDVSECPLALIGHADLSVAAYQRGLRLGTIRMRKADDPEARVVWEQLARSAEIHERLVRAIRRSQSNGD